MTRADEAEAIFKSGLNCAQAVLMAFAEAYGLRREDALRVASGFGGGMGGMGQTCGAVCGAFMVLGLKHPRHDRASAGPSSELVKEFARRFKQRNGTISCRELLGADISTPEGHEAARAAGKFAAVCPKAVRDAVQIIEEMT